LKKIIGILFLLFTLSSCFKEEDSRPAISRYETIALGDDYNNQVFYSLIDTTSVSSNSYKDWSLGFYCGDDASYIRLNAAANMWVIKTNSTDFSTSFGSVYNETDKKFDGSHGLDNLLAIDMYMNIGTSTDTVFNPLEVYLIHPGIDAEGNELGSYKKFMFLGLYYDSYLIRYANLDGTDDHKVLLPKNANLNFISYSFASHNTVNIEPDKTTWDILFSRFTDTVYTTDLTDFLVGYAVTGAYLNQNSVKAYLEESIPFKDINSSNIDVNKLSTKLNVIGHDWKMFSDQYYIFLNKSYVISDREGRLFKLRFLSFYDDLTGQKGYPSFEFEAL
jgi:hypothetical protein